MRVLKFGGTSVGSAETIARVGEIIAELKEEQIVVVVSAVGGITDRLIKTAHMAGSGNEACFDHLQSIVETHQQIIAKLFDPTGVKKVSKLIEHDIEELRIILKGVFLIRELSRKSFESLSGIGERISSKIIATYLGAKWFDSRQYIKTNFEYGRNQVLTNETDQLLAG